MDEFLQRAAPSDVQETIAWLSAYGYTLSSHQGDGTFGAQFRYLGEAKVLITVDRSQWSLDVALTPDAEVWQYELLIAAQIGQAYGKVLLLTDTRSVGDQLPQQLPDGVSWRETLPGILRWVQGDDVRVAVDKAREERNQLSMRQRTGER